MFILEEPYASPLLVNWLESSGHPVLDNSMSRKIVALGRNLNAVSEEECVARIEAGERLCTNAEGALAWIASHVGDPALLRAIALCKDKALMRETLADMYPDLQYRSCAVCDLRAIDASELAFPLVLKPSVGFCSVGVRVVQSPEEWPAAVDEAMAMRSGWGELYPESVVGAGECIIEGYITGREYAIDAYFDESGAPHILNIFRHDFASADDTSDRVYISGREVFDAQMEPFLSWLGQVSDRLAVKSFSMHVEVRVSDDGRIIPIEFNPLRFAGLGGTDLSWYAYGFLTYEAFLDPGSVDASAAISAASPDDLYCMSLISPEGAIVDARIDADALHRRFSDILEAREFDAREVGAYAFLFLRFTPQTRGELDYLLRAPLDDLIS